MTERQSPLDRTIAAMEAKSRREPWTAEHRGTRSDIARGEDFYRVGPISDVHDIDAQCIHVFGPHKKERADLIVNAVNGRLEMLELLGEVRKVMAPGPLREEVATAIAKAEGRS